MTLILKRTLYIGFGTIALAAAGLAGCGNKEGAQTVEPFVKTASPAMPETMAQGDGIGRRILEEADGELPQEIPVVVIEPAPEYLREGVEHEDVAKLQARLMELGFMDNDEPTDYYGSITRAAVMSFQRQNELAMDGIAGQVTRDAIMSPDAKHYAVSKGVLGEDIKRIQQRLYELGYLAAADLITGDFGDVTEAAVVKLQEVNGIAVDGKVGNQTVNLLYSDEIKPNMIAYGEKSEVVLTSQKRLKELGYLTTDPDGNYGLDTSAAVKQFQSRNDLIVDGYLGPSTRTVLNDSGAVPNGLSLGNRGDSVQRVQQLLSEYGYLSSSNVTGYYGEVTENAVKNFQSANGLGSDGSVGRMTMAKLSGTDGKKATIKNPASGGGGKNGGSNSGGSNSGGGNSGGSNSGGGNSGGSTSGGTGGGSSSGGSTNGGSTNGTGVNALISVASSKLGRPYVFGAKGPDSFDCSGFIYWSLNQVGVKQSYLTSSGWRNVGKYTKISSFEDLRPGDIVVVKGHMGIVANGGTVIDASSSNGKVVHRSLSSWWKSNFITGWRIFG